MIPWAKAPTPRTPHKGGGFIRAGPGGCAGRKGRGCGRGPSSARTAPPPAARCCRGQGPVGHPGATGGARGGGPLMTTRDERSAHRLSLGPTPEEAGVLPSNRWTGPAPAPARGPDPRRPRGGPWLAGCVARRSPTTPGGGGAPGTYTHRRCLGTLRCPWRMNGRGAHDGVEGKEPNPTGRPMAECVPGQSRRGDRVGGGGGPAARDRQAEVLLRLQGEVQREHGAGGGGVGCVGGDGVPTRWGGK